MRRNSTNKNPAVGAAGFDRGGSHSGRHVYYATNGRPVASLRGGVLSKRVRASIHMLRKPQGWAMDSAILEAAKRDGVRQVEVFDLETDTRYTAPISAFERHGLTIDRGHGRQVVLPLAYWQIEPTGARQLSFFRGWKDDDEQR